MKSRLIWLGVVTFIVALVPVLPVSWVAWLLPPSLQCREWAGSVWRGECRDLRVLQGGSAMEAEQFRWSLDAGALLHRTIKARFSVRTAQGSGSGVAELGRNGHMAIEDLAISAVLDRRLATMLAEGWNGQLEARKLTVKLQGNTLQALSGEVSLQNFNDGQGTAFGSYRLVFPRATAAPFTGTLSDTGGPYGVEAAVTISADRRWQVNGLISPRPEASPSLRSRLDFLGAADARGRYPLTSEGTFR